jgi:hypothetical protein
MSININISVESSHMVVTADGVYEQSVVLEKFRQAFDAGKREKVSKLLIDFRLVIGDASVMERFEVGLLLAKLINGQTATPLTRIAILGNKSFVDPQRFVEIVAINRGAQVKVTTDVFEAVEWLEI